VTVYIFTGPTLSAEDGAAELDASFVPPAAQGDVYRASLDRPRAIGIIDGYFERIPSVWHKEILWAMSQGIHVFGASSMGALRAAELEPFGMEGVGAVFEAFKRGELEDDDEVAVAHGAAEDGYKVMSEAMVNIRATHRAAAAAGVISDDLRAELDRIAKQLFYAERTYPAILRRGVDRGLPADRLDVLHAWLARGKVNQKRLDALAMLRVMRERLAAGLAPKRADFVFEYTDAWDQVRRGTGRLRVAATHRDDRDAVHSEALVEELRVSGALRRAKLGALVRALSLEEARRQGLAVSADLLQATGNAFRSERGQFDPGDTERWMAEQGLDLDAFTRLLGDEAQVRRIEVLLDQDVMRQLPDHLRVTGEYAALVARAKDKRDLLASRGIADPSLEDAGVAANDLFRWYFTERLGVPMPEALEAQEALEAWARSAGFSDADELRRVVLREYCYLRLKSR
jgi:hypothetical protein